jgi:VWFA-related protein
MKKLFSCPMIAVLFCAFAFSQTPTPEPAERVVTEEIRLNVRALDRTGNAAADLRTEDLVISEDGRLHQASSVRPTPASVLIAMDSGGTIRQKKNIETTRSVASALAGELRTGTHFAVIQSHDRVEQLIKWTPDKREALTAIDTKTGFGRRSSFTLAIEQAEKIMTKAPTENRHLVLITDGLDTIENEAARSEAIRKLWRSGVVVHVISYTQLENRSQPLIGGLLQKGEDNPRRMPEEVMEQLVYAIPVKKIIAKDILRQIYQPRLISLVIDDPFERARKKQSKALAIAQLQLSVLSDYTGGEFFLPDTLEEMTDQAREIAQTINSQFVVTYTPKRPLKDVKADEIRQIEVTSRRPDVNVRASRRLVVFADGGPTK